MAKIQFPDKNNIIQGYVLVSMLVSVDDEVKQLEFLYILKICTHEIKYHSNNEKYIYCVNNENIRFLF